MGTWDVDSIQDDKLIDIEGDCYWCFCKLMNRVEDMYTREQPGIRSCVKKMSNLLQRVDIDLYNHMEKEGNSANNNVRKRREERREEKREEKRVPCFGRTMFLTRFLCFLFWTYCNVPFGISV